MENLKDLKKVLQSTSLENFTSTEKTKAFDIINDAEDKDLDESLIAFKESHSEETTEEFDFFAARTKRQQENKKSGATELISYATDTARQLNIRKNIYDMSVSLNSVYSRDNIRETRFGRTQLGEQGEFRTFGFTLLEYGRELLDADKGIYDKSNDIFGKLRKRRFVGQFSEQSIMRYLPEALTKVEDIVESVGTVEGESEYENLGTNEAKLAWLLQVEEGASSARVKARAKAATLVQQFEQEASAKLNKYAWTIGEDALELVKKKYEYSYLEQKSIPTSTLSKADQYYRLSNITGVYRG